jgi:hypothetical protein
LPNIRCQANAPIVRPSGPGKDGVLTKIPQFHLPCPLLVGLADLAAAGDAALRLTLGKTLPCFPPLVRG